MNARQLKQALEELEAERIPDSLDLWPGLAERLRPARRPGTVPQGALRWAMRLAVAVLLVLAAFIALELLPSRAVTPPASAAPLLHRMADLAGSQPFAEPGGRYRYTRSEEANLSTGIAQDGASYVALVPKTREIWIAPDGSGRIRETAGEAVFLSSGDRAAWEAAGAPDLAFGIHEDFGPGGLFYEDFSQYPMDPDALAAVLRDRASQPGGPPVDAEMFVLVGDLLRQPGVPPSLRAALYRVAAGIPGVELAGPVTDRAGRAGTAVALTHTIGGAKQRFTLIIDPQTSALLAEEQVLLERAGWTGAEPPAVIGYAVYLESGTVPALP